MMFVMSFSFLGVRVLVITVNSETKSSLDVTGKSERGLDLSLSVRILKYALLSKI